MQNATWWCWLAGFLLEILLLARIAQLRLYREFPWFSVWVVADIVVVAVRLPMSGSLYWQVWALTEPIVVLASFLAAYEVFRRLLRGLPDARRIWISVAVGALMAGLIISVAIAGSAESEWTGVSKLRGQFIAAKRFGSTLLFAALASGVMFVRISVPGRNLTAHARVMLVNFGTWTLAFWAMERFGRDVVRPLNLAMMIIWVGCVLAWLVCLRREPVRPDGVEGRFEKTEADWVAYLASLRSIRGR